jgi:hypothetical protein
MRAHGMDRRSIRQAKARIVASPLRRLVTGSSLVMMQRKLAQRAHPPNKLDKYRQKCQREASAMAVDRYIRSGGRCSCIVSVRAQSAKQAAKMMRSEIQVTKAVESTEWCERRMSLW